MSNKGEEKPTTRRAAKTVEEKYADVTLRIIEDHGDEFGPLSPEMEKRLRRKLYLNIMMLLSAINIVLFVSIPAVVSWINSNDRLVDRQVYPWLRSDSWTFRRDGHF